MRKIISLIISCCMLFSCFGFLNVKANTSIYGESMYFSNMEIVYQVTNENQKNNSNYLEEIMRFYSQADGTSYEVRKYIDRIEVYDLNNMQLVSTATRRSYYEETDISESVEENKRNKNRSASQYDIYGKYTYYRSDELNINDNASNTISTILGMLNIWAGYVLVYEVAVWYYNEKYKNLYGKFYRAWNTYCQILVKEKVEFYRDDNNSLVRTEYSGPFWQGDPQDWTQPYYCRVLDEIY